LKLNKRIIQLLVLPKAQTCPIVPSAQVTFYGSSAACLSN
jgi:hypothetical protein